MGVLLLFHSTHMFEQGREAAYVFAFFGLYNVASLWLVHHVSFRRLPMVVLLGVDIVFVAFASYYTGGANSPFLEQCYLIIFMGALYYGLTGGVLTALACVGMEAFLVSLNPQWLWQDVREVVPYFLIAGGLTGYLVYQMQHWFQRYLDTEEVAHQRQLQAQMAAREMELARRMQQAVLPSCAPGVAGFDIAARLEFASEVGGDFYLYFQEKRRVQMVIGDVSGKGFGAALISTSIANMLPLLDPLERPAHALQELNRDLEDRLPPDTFVTMLVADVSEESDKVTLWNCGHPPPLLWKAASQSVQMVEHFDPALGIVPQWGGQPTVVEFCEGDILLLYTDGLTEARNARRDYFETGRAIELLQQNAGASAENIALALGAAVRAWGTVTDDLTILVCKRVAGAVPTSAAAEPRHELAEGQFSI